MNGFQWVAGALPWSPQVSNTCAPMIPLFCNRVTSSKEVPFQPEPAWWVCLARFWAHVVMTHIVISILAAVALSSPSCSDSSDIRFILLCVLVRRSTLYLSAVQGEHRLCTLGKTHICGSLDKLVDRALTWNSVVCYYGNWESGSGLQYRLALSQTHVQSSIVS